MDRSGADQNLVRRPPCSGVTSGAGWQDSTARCQGSFAHTVHWFRLLVAYAHWRPLPRLRWVRLIPFRSFAMGCVVSWPAPSLGRLLFSPWLSPSSLRCALPFCGHGMPPIRYKQTEPLQRGQPPAFQRRPPVLARLTGWRWRIKGGVQAQAGDEGNGLSQRLAAVEQVQDGVAAVAHQHHGPVGQPAAQLQDHMAGPVSELLVAASTLPVVAFRGRQHGEKGQGPIAFRPGDMAQPHQGDPAQATGLDQVAPAGTHRGAVPGIRRCRKPRDHHADPGAGAAA